MSQMNHFAGTAPSIAATIQIPEVIGRAVPPTEIRMASALFDNGNDILYFVTPRSLPVHDIANHG
jgi:hypothetical protein